MSLTGQGSDRRAPELPTAGVIPGYSADMSTTGRTGAAPRRRLRPGQGKLLGVTALLVVGAFLPWLYTVAGNVGGMRGPGLWTFYASMLSLAGALVPHRRLAGVQAVVAGLAGVVLPVWQALHALTLLGVQGWMPGPGLVMTLGGGVLALVAARQLLTGSG